MIFKEYKRLLKSKHSIIILVLFAISAISFYMSHCEKQMFVDQLYHDFSEDLNRDNLAYVVEQYNGIRFLFNFWFESDFAQIAVTILYIWAGIFLAPNLYLHKEQGFGNWITTRISYKDYVINNITSQALYIVTVISVTTLLQFLLAFIWGGSFYSTTIGSYELGILGIAIISILQIIVLSVFVFLVSGISMMCATFIKNKYVIQTIPLVGFAVLPMLAASTVGNFSSSFASLIIYFEVYNVSNLISNIFQSSFSVREIIFNILPIIIYGSIFIILSCYHIKKNERDYL